MTLEEARKIDPTLNDVPDEELRSALDDLDAFIRLAFDFWLETEGCSNSIPERSLPAGEEVR